MTVESDLFAWWAISITGGSIFLTLVSIYLYARALWVLLGLLVFYIVSVNIESAAIFAVGNIIVEVLLALYLMRHRRPASSYSD